MPQIPRSLELVLGSGIALLAALSGCDFFTAAPPVDAITIRQAVDTLDVDQTTAFSASLSAGGTDVANSAALRWASSDPAVFTIDSLSGVGRAYDVSVPRAVTVTAKVQSVEATSRLIIFPRVTGLKLLVSSNVAVNHVLTLRARLGDYRVAPYTQATAAWGARFRSADPAIVRANPDGTLTAITPGTTRLTVDLHGKSDSVSVTVVPGYATTFLPGTAELDVVDVNDSADVVATAGLQSILFRGGQRIDLGPCRVRGLNNRGQVLCTTSVYENGVFTPLFGSGALQGEASGIDETGAVLGLLMQPDSLRSRAFFWQAGAIDVLAGVDFRLQSTGRIAAGVGLGQVSFVYTYSVLLRRDGPISTSGADRTGVARAINGSGNVVGEGGKATGRGGFDQLQCYG